MLVYQIMVVDEKAIFVVEYASSGDASTHPLPIPLPHRPTRRRKLVVMLYLDPKQLLLVPVGSKPYWAKLSVEARQFLEDEAPGLIEELRSTRYWPEAERAIHGYVEHPSAYVRGLLDQLAAAADAAWHCNMEDPALRNIVQAFDPDADEPNGLGTRMWLKVMSDNNLIREVVERLGLRGVIIALWVAWYIEADENQPGSLKYRQLKEQKPARP